MSDLKEGEVGRRGEKEKAYSFIYWMNVGYSQLMLQIVVAN